MNIQNISLTDIHPYAHNPRKNDEAVNAVAASIREFGFLVPLVIDRGHEIVAGHTRYRAAKALGISTLQSLEEPISEFSPDLWGTLLDHVTVYTVEDIRFTFRNGIEIKV